jgi:hypothetical protein
MGLFGFFNKIPKASAGFNFTDPDSGFEEKLRELVRQSTYQNLKDNIDGILSVLKQYSHYLRSGGLDSWQKKSALDKIKKLEHNLTNDDIREIKQILDRLGK